MSTKQKSVREPLIHITKRDGVSMWTGIAIRAAAIVLSIVVCALLVVLITGADPVEFFSAVMKGSFGSKRKMWMAGQDVAMLLCIALAVTPAFKMRYWNLGAEGQVLIGGLAAGACMIYVGNALPTTLLLIVMFVASLLAGAVWAVIPALFKAKWNTNESLFTLMMNYVAMQLVSFFIVLWENPKGSGQVGIINMDSQAGWLPSIGGQKYLLNILIVAAVTVGMFIYLRYSKQGYEISVVGESENTARYSGINVKKVIVRTVAISGAICGLAGLMLVAGTDHSISTDTAGGDGFTAIIVSWLAKFNPFMMVLASFLIIFLQRGAGEIATALRLNTSIADILTGVILFFIIGCEFFINYKINFRKKGGNA